jgi:hypothetical protein
MGPFNEMKQLERKAQVLAVLQRNDLSAWARNYWGTVFDTIAMTEDRYNARVVKTFENIKPTPKGYISYE